MGELFRSREVQLVHIYFQLDACHDTLEELGKHGIIQFNDLNNDVSPFQRNFINDIKITDDMQRSLRYFEEQKIIIEDDNPRAFEYIEYEFLEGNITNSFTTIESLQNYFEELEEELKEIEGNQKILKTNLFELTELKQVLIHSDKMFEKSQYNQDDSSSLGYLSGTIEREKLFTFEKLLWRVTRGNIYFRHSEINEAIYDPASRDYKVKNVFLMFFQGENTKLRLERICSSFNTGLYPCPASTEERASLLSDISTRISELRTVIDKSISRQCALLDKYHCFSNIWNDFILKEKAIYHCMNMFEYDTGRRCLIAEGWCPTEFLKDVQQALTEGAVCITKNRSRVSVAPILNVIPTRKEPPTFQKTNDFTSAFQDIVDMYGIARYREVNPGLFTIITFPFLFGVMFGDVGHGLLLLMGAIGLLICWKLIKNPSESVQNALDNKWLILLMSLFSIYCGFMYNECFSIPLALFNTNWEYPDVMYKEGLGESHRIDDNYAYPFGVDPLWMGSKNSLDYYNSLKMKMSILFGVSQMVLGIILSFVNYKYFKQTKRIFCEFIPQLGFLLSIFGYLCFLIILKWTINWEDASRAPRILNLLTDMILAPWKLDDKYIMFYGQHAVQVILLLFAGICVPWMLLAKPFVILYQRKRAYKVTSVSTNIPMVAINESGKEITDDDMYYEDEMEITTEHTTNDHEPDDISEVFIHQGIHTIEFVLGCISNTASYLRLWALSLAHSELSAVFWERVLLASLQTGNFFLIFCGWSVWAVLTMGVLLGMESLSAFLHALRLHWVEFQNKFYQGDGHKFIPFSFNIVLSTEEEY